MVSPLPASAQPKLNAEAKTPYQLQVVLHLTGSRVFTPLYQDQVQNELSAQLNGLFGPLARVEVTRTHPIQREIKSKGFLAALDGWDDLSSKTTAFVLIDQVDGAYQIHLRFHEGRLGQAGAFVPPARTFDRNEVARETARMIEGAFCPVGAVTSVGKDVTLTLQAGALGPIDRWVKKGHVFAVNRISQGGGQAKADRLEWALLEVLDPPVQGACRCKYWRRYQEDDLVPSPGTGYLAQRLATTPGPVKIMLLDEKSLTPIADMRVRVQRPGSEKFVEVLTNPNGLAVTQEAFGHMALVLLPADGGKFRTLPIELMAGRTVVARVGKATAGSEALAPFEARRDAWLRRVYENSRMSTERSQALAAQLHQSLDGARDAGKKSLPTLEEEIKYLETERDQLGEIAKAKKWPFVTRDGDREIVELKKQAKELQALVERLDAALKDAGSEKEVGLVKLVERARLLESEAEFDQAVKLYEQVLEISPKETKVRAQLDKVRKEFPVAKGAHAEAREFVYRVWPTLDVAGLGKNMDEAKKAIAICKDAGDRGTPLKFLRASAGHTVNLKKQLELLNRRDSEDNRNKAKTMIETSEKLIRLHQDTATWLGLAKE